MGFVENLNKILKYNYQTNSDVNVLLINILHLDQHVKPVIPVARIVMELLMHNAYLVTPSLSIKVVLVLKFVQIMHILLTIHA